MARRSTMVVRDVSRTFSVQLTEDVSCAIYLNFQDILAADLLDIFGVEKVEFVYHGFIYVSFEVDCEYYHGTKSAAIRLLESYTSAVRAALSAATAILLKSDEDYGPVTYGVAELCNATKGSWANVTSAIKLLSKIDSIRIRRPEPGAFVIDILSPGILEDLKRAHHANHTNDPKSAT